VKQKPSRATHKENTNMESIEKKHNPRNDHCLQKSKRVPEKGN